VGGKVDRELTWSEGLEHSDARFAERTADSVDHSVGFAAGVIDGKAAQPEGTEAPLGEKEIAGGVEFVDETGTMRADVEGAGVGVWGHEIKWAIKVALVGLFAGLFTDLGGLIGAGERAVLGSNFGIGDPDVVSRVNRDGGRIWEAGDLRVIDARLFHTKGGEGFVFSVFRSVNVSCH